MERKKKVYIQVKNVILFSSFSNIILALNNRIQALCLHLNDLNNYSASAFIDWVLESQNHKVQLTSIDQAILQYVLSKGNHLCNNNEINELISDKINNHQKIIQKSLFSFLLPLSHELPKNCLQIFDNPLIYSDPLLNNTTLKELTENFETVFFIENSVEEIEKQIFQFYWKQTYEYPLHFFDVSCKKIKEDLEFILVDYRTKIYSEILDTASKIGENPKLQLKLVLLARLPDNLHLDNNFNNDNEMICTLDQLPSKLKYLDIMERKNVGYIFHLEKAFQLLGMGCLKDSEKISYIVQDPRVPIGKRLHGIFHKIQDFLKKPNSLTTGLFNSFNAWSIPKYIKLVDDPQHLNLVLDRKQFQDALIKILDSAKIKLKVPKAIEIILSNETNQNSTIELIKKNNINFPLILKTSVACGNSASHQMALIANEDCLKKLNKKTDIFTKFNHIAQEFIDHNNKIYKVYVIGTKILVSIKESIPNLKGVLLEDVIMFDSQRPFDCTIPQINTASKISEISMEFINNIIKIINEQLRLTMFGIDLIVNSENEDVYIIDLNYFPSFKSIKELPLLIENHFLNQTYSDDNNLLAPNI